MRSGSWGGGVGEAFCGRGGILGDKARKQGLLVQLAVLDSCLLHMLNGVQLISSFCVILHMHFVCCLWLLYP